MNNSNRRSNKKKNRRDAPSLPPRDPFAPLPSTTPPTTQLDPFAPKPTSTPADPNPFTRSTPNPFRTSTSTPSSHPHPAFAAAQNPSAFGTTAPVAPSVQHTRHSFAQPSVAPFPPPSAQSFAPGAASAKDPFAPRHGFSAAQEHSHRALSHQNRQADPFAPRPSQPSAPSAAGGGRRLSSKIIIPRVPPALFSREAILAHFRSLPDVNPVDVSLRGSLKGKDNRRTAVLSFQSPEDASHAMKQARSHHGNTLPLYFFKEGAGQIHPEPMETNNHPPRSPPPTTQMSNELLFSFVPEELFSEEAVRHLFNSISSNRVLAVSIRSRPHRGSVKRTAIVRFPDIAGAKAALEMLPLYKGQRLNVSYRNKPPHLLKKDERQNIPQKDIFNENRNDHWDDSEPWPFEPNDPWLKAPRIPEPQDETEHWGQPFDNDVSQEHHADAMFSGSDEAVGITAGTTPSAAGDNVEREKERLRKEIAAREHANARKSSLRDRMKTGNRSSDGTVSKAMDERSGRREAKSSKKVVREGNNGNGTWRNTGTKIDLQDAVEFVGTCRSMCPEKEIAERILQRDISMFETVDGKGGEPDPTKAVKKYRRSAAISEEAQPEEVRPPKVLVRTMEHLKGVCDRTDCQFVDIHNFVRDRTRSLRQDFTYQGVRDESCIKIHEESVRFHIMSEHLLTGCDPAKFSSKQNREQLDKCLISLREMYDLRHEKGLSMSPNEPEMQAYYMLTQMSNPKTCVQLCTGFVRDVRKSLPVQFALHVVEVASDSFGNYVSYFDCVRAAPYLMACLMHAEFTRIRSRALAVINATHGNLGSPDVIDIGEVTLKLGFESQEETTEFCLLLGMDIITVGNSRPGAPANRAISTPSAGFNVDNAAKWKPKSAQVVIESKRDTLVPSDIIAGTDAGKFDVSKVPSARLLDRQLVRKREQPAITSIPSADAAPEDEGHERGTRGVSFQSSPAKKGSIFDRLGSAATATRRKSPGLEATQAEDLDHEPEESHGESNAIPVAGSSSVAWKTPSTAPTSVFGATAFPVPIKSVLKDAPTTEASGANMQAPPVPLTPKAKKVSFADGNGGYLHPGANETGTVPLGGFTKASPEQESVSWRPQLQLGSAASADQRGHMRARATASAEEKELDEGFERRRQQEAEVQALKLREEAEAARRKALAEEAILQHEAELEAARKRVQDDTMLAEAMETFEQMLCENAATGRKVMTSLRKIEGEVKGMCLEKQGREQIREACDNANIELTELSDEVKHCVATLEAATPLSNKSAAARDKLLEDFEQLRSFGLKVWKLAWGVKGSCLVTSDFVPNPKPKLTCAEHASTYIERRTPSVLAKRKAVDDTKEQPAVTTRARSHGGSAVHWNAPKKARTSVNRNEKELDAVATEMDSAHLIRWQAVVMNRPENPTASETRLWNWVRRRMGGTEVPQNGVLRQISERSSDRVIQMSVTEVQAPFRIPPTANVIIFAVEGSHRQILESRIAWMEACVTRMRDYTAVIGSAPPALIVVLERMKGESYASETTHDLNVRLNSLQTSGMITGYHVTDVSIACAEYFDWNEDFASSLKKTVRQTVEAMKSRSIDLQARCLGEYLVEVGNSAWMQWLSATDDFEDSNRWHEVVGHVNSVWSSVATALGEEERRWPEEMEGERKRLRDVRMMLRRNIRLPLPDELSVTRSDEYIKELAKRSGVACPSLRLGVQALSRFCRGLGHLLMPFMSSVLRTMYFTEVHLPRACVPKTNAEAYRRLRRRLASDGRSALSPLVGIENGRNSTYRVYVNARRLLGVGYNRQQKRKELEPGTMDSVRNHKRRRCSLDLLSRTLEFSPAPIDRRRSMPTSTERAGEKWSVYDEIIRTEQAHARMLDETIAVLKKQVESQTG